MKNLSYLLIISMILSCHTAKRSEVVDYYPRPSIPNLGNNSKNTVFLYKKREISEQQFVKLASNKKNLSIIIIKDSNKIKGMNYNPVIVHHIVMAKPNRK
ncbi:hypothetical protein JSO61_010170 [Riemerella anatipestifer]|uniref:hypothetical protein n=1 Tax=Riemerella anatipestifer TaxID=34085 RepID=UPI002A8F38D9|nr:hypothetical protein [Riemerella anatipestifer]